MSLPDDTVANDLLDWSFGDTPPAPPADWHDLLLHDANGDELTVDNAPGYERARVQPEDWAPAADRSKSVVVTFAEPTDEWEPAVSWSLLGSDERVWHEASLVDPLLVTAASEVGPSVVVTVFYEAGE